ncbi:MAG: TIGR02221 family CRISPR-associated protein [Desulfococcaceae bacterium]
MSRQVYLSFLGLGSRDPKTGFNKYQETTYELGGRPSAPTEFVQVAEMELLEGKRFDLVLIVATQKSFDAHFENLESQMRDKGIFPKHLIIDEEMGPEDQWKWFELILDHIEHGDILTVDLTHGYRSIPIIFSAAINFLQKARAVRLDAVYYGAFDKNRRLAPIIDMKDF